VDDSFHIGPWLVDPSVNTVSRNGTSTRLEPKVMEVLVCLASHAGAPVSKEKLLQTVWPETFVTDDVLTRCISELRKALEDDTKEPQFIQTIPRKGYRLVAEVRPLKPKGRKWRFVYALVVVASLAILALLMLKRNMRKAPGGNLSIQRLTSSGKVNLAAVSSDGKYLVYREDDGDKQSLWLQQMATGSRSALLPSAQVNYTTVRFSPDSNYIYYSRREETAGSILYQIPALGGVPRKLLAEAPDFVGVSPDGKSLAFVRRKGEDSELVIKRVDGSEERTLANRRGSVLFADPVAWSRDGKFLAAVEASRKSVLSWYIVVVPADGGPETKIPREGMMRIYRPEWLPDGKSLIAAAMGTHFQLWQFSYPKGDVRRITSDPQRYDEVSLTADSQNLVSISTDYISSIWVAPAADPDKARPVSPRGGHFVGMMGGLTWTPDGRIIYLTNTSDQYHFILTTADGSDPRPLPLDGYKWYPDVCPDGHTLIFSGSHAGGWAILRGDLNGDPPKPISTFGEPLSCSPDGKWVVYNDEFLGLRKVSIDGGPAILLTSKPCDEPDLSPDGQWIACRDENRRLAIIPFTGGPAARAFDLPPTADAPFQWVPDGQAVAFVDKGAGADNIWVQPIAGGAPRPLTHFTTEGIASFAWSKDGKQIAIARGTLVQDAVLITGFR